MTKEQALIRYINLMSSGKLGYSKERRVKYLASSRKELTTLRLNKRNDIDRYNTLETERESIRLKFLGENFPVEEDFTTLYARILEIDDELTTLWQVDADMPDLFEIT